jgi:UPF0042 nucleotide-binding protein
MKRLKIFIITGLSGSGKSTAIAAFEDAGFFCVDNLPVALLPKFLELPIESGADITGFAFVMDLREKGFLSEYHSVFAFLKEKGYPFEILFLEANENILIQRFSQTRRHHPLAKGKSLADGIREETERLKEIREFAGQIIDTSHYTVHELKKVIIDLAVESNKRVPMQIRLKSFGFKHGIPQDADIIMDVRFLPNPFFVPELNPLNGKQEQIQNFVLQSDVGRIFIEKFQEFIEFLIPLYEKEGKAYLTVAIGCTGGRHRSVAVTSRLYAHINTPERWVQITHRDMEKD